jgi:hypothetical protein
MYGALVSRATALDVALTHIRLSTLDLTDAELARIVRVRLLLAQVSAIALDVEAHAVLHRSDRADNLRRLAALVREGRIEVRSAPLAAWSPDFSVFGTTDAPFALIVGPHQFERSDFPGPTLASVHGRRGATRAGARFEEIWGSGHDIGAAIDLILTRAERRVGGPEPAPARAGESVETPTGTRVFG